MTTNPVNRATAASELAFALHCVETGANLPPEQDIRHTNLDRDAACAIRRVFDYLEKNKEKLP